MKVNPSNNPQHLGVNDLYDTRKARETQQNKAPDQSTEFQTTAQPTSQDIDTARVNNIRQAISEGRLELHPERIADGIIASARELLDDQS